MSDELTRAARDAVEATDNTEQVRLIAAVLQAQAITQAVQPQPPIHQPIKAHPWGAYIAGGCVGVLALVVLVVAIAFVVFGFAILAAVLALAVVALTICILVLRGLWNDYRKGR